jgi:hypothetical protein
MASNAVEKKAATDVLDGIVENVMKEVEADPSKILFFPNGGFILGRSRAAPLKLNAAGDPICRCGIVLAGVSEQKERLRLIGRIVVQEQLPAGDPCWMAAWIGSFVGLPPKWNSCATCFRVGCPSCINNTGTPAEGA